MRIAFMGYCDESALHSGPWAVLCVELNDVSKMALCGRLFRVSVCPAVGVSER
jgi:hypothetical protein